METQTSYLGQPQTKFEDLWSGLKQRIKSIPPSILTDQRRAEVIIEETFTLPDYFRKIPHFSCSSENKKLAFLLKRRMREIKLKVLESAKQIPTSNNESLARIEKFCDKMREFDDDITLRTHIKIREKEFWFFTVLQSGIPITMSVIGICLIIIALNWPEFLACIPD